MYKRQALVIAIVLWKLLKLAFKVALFVAIVVALILGVGAYVGVVGQHVVPGGVGRGQKQEEEERGRPSTVHRGRSITSRP